jgi:hypothetical protein
MAEAAVATRRRIVVAAALPSTLKPTLALIADCARAAARTPDVVEVLCEDAWPHFQRGDVERYAEEIARAVRRVATEADVVVLAQASMAPAAPLLNGAGILALASPELGVRAALATMRG